MKHFSCWREGNRLWAWIMSPPAGCVTIASSFDSSLLRGGNLIAPVSLQGGDFLRQKMNEVPQRVVVFLEPAGPLVWRGSATIKRARFPAEPALHTLYTLFNLYCSGLPPFSSVFLLLVTFSRWASMRLGSVRSGRKQCRASVRSEQLGPEFVLQRLFMWFLLKVLLLQMWPLTAQVGFRCSDVWR